MRHKVFPQLASAMLLALPCLNGHTTEPVLFHDIAQNGGAGLSYARTESKREALYDTVREINSFNDSYPQIPLKGRGIPGIALLDYDNDGDMDIYVTNGPGSPNSLFSNQQIETGQFVFVDVALEAGVDLTDQDSNGVCFGDIDNDGDNDLYVTGAGESNRLLLNNSDGSFTDITIQSNSGAGNLWTSMASMGDVNNDGLLDIFIANFGNMEDSSILNTVPFEFNEPNQLLLNIGGNQFRNVSGTSGILHQTGMAPGLEYLPTPTHACAMVDYDQDGDLDIITADDQAGVPTADRGGIDRGLIHLFENDGTGQFVDVNVERGLARPGAWMGFGFGDFDMDGHLDIFASNFGVYNPTNAHDPHNHEIYDCRMFFGGEGVFHTPEKGPLYATPFGWGASGSDYDNDGDTDLIFYGAMDAIGFVVLSNPGMILQNQQGESFTWDQNALSESIDHRRRSVQGMAVGDLNGDGFVDITSVSNFDVPSSTPLQIWHDQDGPLDGIAAFLPTLGPFGDPPTFRYNPNLPRMDDGTLSVEINSGNDQNFVIVQLMGTSGITSHGKTNRSGIGATMSFWPHGGEAVKKPQLAGSGYASQHALETIFGLGSDTRGCLEVLWPGGVKTRLYNLKHGEKVVVPELPVGFDQAIGFGEYTHSVRRHLQQLVEQNLITSQWARRILGSAKLAWLRHRNIF